MEYGKRCDRQCEHECQSYQFVVSSAYFTRSSFCRHAWQKGPWPVNEGDTPHAKVWLPRASVAAPTGDAAQVWLCLLGNHWVCLRTVLTLKTDTTASLYHYCAIAYVRGLAMSTSASVCGRVLLVFLELLLEVFDLPVANFDLFLQVSDLHIRHKSARSHPMCVGWLSAHVTYLYLLNHSIYFTTGALNVGLRCHYSIFGRHLLGLLQFFDYHGLLQHSWLLLNAKWQKRQKTWADLSNSNFLKTILLKKHFCF